MTTQEHQDRPVLVLVAVGLLILSLSLSIAGVWLRPEWQRLVPTEVVSAVVSYGLLVWLVVAAYRGKQFARTALLALLLLALAMRLFAPGTSEVKTMGQQLFEVAASVFGAIGVLLLYAKRTSSWLHAKRAP